VARSSRRALRPLPACALLLALVAGCGAPPFVYVANSEQQTYVKIPNTWQPMDQRELAAVFGLGPAVNPADVGVWQLGYDAAPAPSAAHLFGQHTEAPVAFISVQEVAPRLRGQFSLDRLRNLFFPITPEARQLVAGRPTLLSDLTLLSDQVLTPGDGLRGVRLVYRARVAGGPLQIFDQTAYLNDDASTLYVFYVRCSTVCYQERQQEIDDVVASFTVREG
jgi:hypothetical protein